MPGTATPRKRTGENSMTRPVQLIRNPTTPVNSGTERRCSQSTCWKHQSIGRAIAHLSSAGPAEGRWEQRLSSPEVTETPRTPSPRPEMPAERSAQVAEAADRARRTQRRQVGPSLLE